MATYPPNTVIINVYDIIGANVVLHAVGLGVHHTGVEVYGVEYGFGRGVAGSGIFAIDPPKTCAPHVFRESVVVGTTDVGEREMRRHVDCLMRDPFWAATGYHLIHKNCNTFSEFFAESILSPHSKEALCMTNSRLFYCGWTRLARSSADDKQPAHKERCVMPSWANRVARAAGKILPNKLILVLENADRKAQGVAPLGK